MATQITATIGKDFGGYWDIGTQGTLGSSMAATAGKAYGAWVKCGETGVIPFMLTWFGVSTMPNQYNGFMLNTTVTTDYAPAANNIYVAVESSAGVGWAYWIDVSGTVNFNDGNYHHIMLSFSGLTSGKPTSAVIYIDAVPFDLLAAHDVSDPGGLTGTCSDFAQASYIGCDGKTNAMTPIDMSTLAVEDMRIYTEAKSAAEVKQIVALRGKDMLRKGLLTRYPFWADGRNLGPNAYTAVAHNNGGGSITPTFVSPKATSGTRRRVM